MKNIPELPCAIVEDLLPAYVERLTSEETTAAVEAHLASCPACAAKRAAKAAIADGSAQVVIGTHALLTGDVETAFYTETYTASDMFFIQIGKSDTICCLSLPRIQLRLMRSYAIIIHIVRHDFCRTLDFVIRTTMKGVRTPTPNPTIKVHSNDLIAGIVRYINIIDININCWIKSRKCLSDFLLSSIRNFLSDYLQRLGGNTKNQPSSLRIEESTSRMHAVLQLAGSFL